MKKLDKYLNKWFLKHADVDIKFKEGASFEEDTVSDRVVYSFTEKTPGDREFRKLCIRIEPEVAQFDDFILGLFHEVGHILTDDEIEDEDYEGYEQLLNDMGDNPGPADYKKYYNHPIEFMATYAGMQLIKDNIKGVKHLAEKIAELK